MEKLKVLVVDDHTLFRSGLALIINASERFRVVGEGGDGSEVKRLVERTLPDVLLLDITMRERSGLDVLPEIRKDYPNLPIVMLSMHTRSDIVMQCLRGGACGYLLKDAAETELLLALEAARKGQQYLSPAIARSVLSMQSSFQEERAHLTERQSQVLQLIALGRGTKEIAYELGLSVKTVESHRSHLMQRLKIRDVPGLVKYAITEGLIELPLV